MSAIFIVYIGIFILASTGANIRQDDAPNRDGRSLKRINKMLEESGNLIFKNKTYDSFCRPVGGGEPADSPVSCCESHDLCYKNIMQTTTICDKVKRKDGIYSLKYIWKIVDDTATCGDNPPCPDALCDCDVRLVNCLRSIDSHKTSYSTTPHISTSLLQKKAPTTPQSPTSLPQKKAPTTPQSPTSLPQNKAPTTPQSSTSLPQNKVSTTPQYSTSLQNKAPTTPQSPTSLLQNKAPTTPQSSTSLLHSKTPSAPHTSAPTLEE